MLLGLLTSLAGAAGPTEFGRIPSCIEGCPESSTRRIVADLDHDRSAGGAPAATWVDNNDHVNYG